MYSAYRRALRYAAPYWGRFVWVFLVGILASSVGLLQPYFSKLLIDEALLKRDFDALVWISAAMIGATIAGFVLNILSSYVYVRASSGVLFDMRLELYRHLQHLSPRTWANLKMGDVISRINNDISEVQRVTSDSLMGIFTNVVFFFGSALIMASLNRKLMLLSLVAIPLSLAATQFFQKRLQTRVKLMRERSAEIGSFLLETLLGVRTVVASRAQGREEERFRRKNNSFVAALLDMQIISFLAGAVPGTLVAAVSGGLFLYGGRMVIDGEISTGDLIAIMAYHGRLLSPVQNLMGLYTSIMTGAVSLDRVYELLDTQPEIVEQPGAVALPAGPGEIECDNVTFRHGERNILQNLSFRVAPGTLCALVGPSGVGKSTLGELLARHYDPGEGAIRIDGQDLRHATVASVRQAVMLVDQTPYLFQTTIRENIAYARPEAAQAEIEAVARAAAIHDRILELPGGYDAVVAERGQTLSAGERQRIALARALLADPRVLILDEPTSSLDEANEAAIAQTLETALRGRTAILITHRRNLARIASQTVELKPLMPPPLEPAQKIS
jgi:ATP-binding cassette, subfamily B, bacterial